MDGPFNHEIYKPWFFRPESWEEVEKYAGQFDPQTAERKLYFRGVQSGARKCLEHFPSDPDLNIIWGTFAKNNKIQQSEYYKELLKHRVSLSIPGAGDMCHRDIECFGMPPVVMRLGQSAPDALGRPGIIMYSFVPKLRPDRWCCSLHKPKVDFSTMGRT